MDPPRSGRVAGNDLRFDSVKVLCDLRNRKNERQPKPTAATSFFGILWLVNRHRADRLVAAAQVTEGHSGVEHVKEWNL